MTNILKELHNTPFVNGAGFDNNATWICFNTKLAVNNVIWTATKPPDCFFINLVTLYFFIAKRAYQDPIGNVV